MKKNNMVGYNVSLYDCPNPQEFWNVAKPKNCIDSIWIPQTIGDQIWMWFEFANEDDKIKRYDGALTKSFIRKIYDIIHEESCKLQQ
jgi:hypothetical protein